MKYLGVIPARLGSTRLPRKVLRMIAGAPLVAWVYSAARACPLLDDVILAADSEEVMLLARQNGWSAILTSSHCASGSDRVFEVSQKVEADIYVNIQGDEPLLRVEHIESLLRPFASAGALVSTLATPCPADEIGNPNVVKVVTAADGRAVYFSRAAIPYTRDQKDDGQSGVGNTVSDAAYQKHLGFYAYRRETLRQFATLRPGPLELAERLEQLRFLENGIPIHVEKTPFDTIGVDTEDDLTAAGLLLEQKQLR